MLDPVVFVALVHRTRTWGRARTEALLQFAALVKPELTARDHLRLHRTRAAVERCIAQWADPAQLALAISNEQRRTPQFSDARTATFATVLLDRDVTPEAWRQRVKRRVATQGLPALEGATQPKRVDPGEARA